MSEHPSGRPTLTPPEQSHESSAPLTHNEQFSNELSRRGEKVAAWLAHKDHQANQKPVRRNGKIRLEDVTEAERKTKLAYKIVKSKPYQAAGLIVDVAATFEPALRPFIPELATAEGGAVFKIALDASYVLFTMLETSATGTEELTSATTILNPNITRLGMATIDALHYAFGDNVVQDGGLRSMRLALIRLLARAMPAIGRVREKVMNLIKTSREKVESVKGNFHILTWFGMAMMAISGAGVAEPRTPEEAWNYIKLIGEILAVTGAAGFAANRKDNVLFHHPMDRAVGAIAAQSEGSKSVEDMVDHDMEGGSQIEMLHRVGVQGVDSAKLLEKEMDIRRDVVSGKLKPGFNDLTFFQSDLVNHSILVNEDPVGTNEKVKQHLFEAASKMKHGPDWQEGKAHENENRVVSLHKTGGDSLYMYAPQGQNEAAIIRHAKATILSQRHCLHGMRGSIHSGQAEVVKVGDAGSQDVEMLGRGMIKTGRTIGITDELGICLAITEHTQQLTKEPEELIFTDAVTLKGDVGRTCIYTVNLLRAENKNGDGYVIELPPDVTQAVKEQSEKYKAPYLAGDFDETRRLLRKLRGSTELREAMPWTKTILDYIESQKKGPHEDWIMKGRILTHK